jgi:hypothetical protein
MLLTCHLLITLYLHTELLWSANVLMSLVLPVLGSNTYFSSSFYSTSFSQYNGVMGYQCHKNNVEHCWHFMRSVMSIMCIFFRARTLFIHLILVVILCPTPEAIRILVAKISKYQPQSVLGL